VSEEDHAVYLLASLPESYNVLVTALEANEAVPKLEVVTERIFHQEKKMKSTDDASSPGEHAMTSRKSFYKQKPIRCLHCGKVGHIKRYCRVYKREKGVQKETKDKAHTTASMAAQEDSSSESSGLWLVKRCLFQNQVNCIRGLLILEELPVICVKTNKYFLLSSNYRNQLI